MRSSVMIRTVGRGEPAVAALGAAARRLLALGQDGDDARALLDEARAALGELAGNRCWAPLAEHRSARDPLADTSLRELLLSTGTAALQALLDQRDARAEPLR